MKEIDKAKLEVLSIIQELSRGHVTRSRKRYLKNKLAKLKARYV